MKGEGASLSLCWTAGVTMQGSKALLFLILVLDLTPASCFIHLSNIMHVSVLLHTHTHKPSSIWSVVRRPVHQSIRQVHCPNQWPVFVCLCVSVSLDLSLSNLKVNALFSNQAHPCWCVMMCECVFMCMCVFVSCHISLVSTQFPGSPPEP